MGRSKERAFEQKKKSTNTSPYPDEVIDRLARAFYPAILACWNSEEGQREFAAWQAEQAHHAPSKEKQSVPDGERPVVHIAIVCGLWQGASAGRTPVFVLPFNLLTHGFQPHSSIFLRVTVQDQVCIAQWGIVDEVVQLCPLHHGYIKCIFKANVFTFCTRELLQISSLTLVVG